MSDKENPMLQRALNWSRPRRWSILAEAVFTVLLVLAAWPIVASDDEAEGAELVTDYLEALRDGDVREAESYIGPGLYPDADESWLTEEALSSDWEIESVRHRSAYDRYVHAVISSGGETAESVFSLEETEEGLRIINPYLYLTVPGDPLRSLELNGRHQALGTPADVASTTVALFPGSYAMFESVPGLSGQEAMSFLAMPRDRPTELRHLVGEPIAGSAELEAQLNEDLAAWIDFCVQSTVAAPEGCPFSAESSYGGNVDDGVREFEETGDLTWAVDVYPQVRIRADLTLETVVPGWVSLSGTGIDAWEGTEEQVRGRCRISTADIVPTMLADGRFEFTASQDLSSTCGHGLT